MVRLVLFDIDGTLIQSGGAGEQAFGRVCAMEFNVPNGTAHLRFAGRTDPSIVREFFMANRIDPNRENFRRFFECYVFWLDHTLHTNAGRVLPGVFEILAQLSSLPSPPVVGLLTGNIRLGAEIKLTHYKLWNSFVMGGFGDDHEDRNCLAAIARDRGQKVIGEKLSGDQILVIGDTPWDVECGKAIGARVLAVATGHYAREQLDEHKPAWSVESLDAIAVEELCR
jgi:phosphoglycolate phosphatase-like HAD superfamily hydrolase